MRHPWPGNVRQLQHVLRTAVALADGATLTPEHLPALQDPGHQPADAVVPSEPLAPEQAQERQALLEALEAARWNVSKVSKDLGVSRNTLYRRMHRLQIPVTATRADRVRAACDPGACDCELEWSTSSS